MSPASCADRTATRRNEYVVVSAHLDHLGVGEPINGDRIYNGAMDNASGVAAILEVAHTLHESGAKPARSILFVAVTSEENGLLGSRYFAAHPTVPAESIVANVNTDMFLPLFPLKTLMVLGLDESDLGRTSAPRPRSSASACRPIPNRSAIASSAAISTASSRRASRRWR